MSDNVFDLTVFKTTIENKLKEKFNLFGNDNFQAMNYTEIFNVVSNHLQPNDIGQSVNSETELRCLTLKNLNDQLKVIKENLATNAAILGTARIELLTIYSNYNWVNSVIKKFRESVSEQVATVSGTVPPISNNSPTQNTVLGPAQYPQMELSQFVKTKLNSLMESFKLVQSNAVNLSFNNTSNQLNSRPQLQLSDNDVDNFTQIFGKYNEYKTKFAEKQQNLINAICTHLQLLMVQKCLSVLIDLRKLQCPEEAEFSC